MNESVIAGIIFANDPARLAWEIISLILMVVAGWKIFEKAGLDGWKTIIPFYSGYQYYKIAWTGKMFWVNVALYGLADVLAYIFVAAQLVFVMIIGFIIMLLSVGLRIAYRIKLAKRFGKGVGFGIGLVILAPIFLLILAFGAAEYQKGEKA